MGSQASFLASVSKSSSKPSDVKMQPKTLQLSLKYYDEEGNSQPAGYLNLFEGSDKAQIITRIQEEGFQIAPPLSEVFSWQDFLSSQRPFDCYITGSTESIGSVWPIKANIKGFKPLTREELHALKKAGNLFIAGGGPKKLSEEAKAYLV